MDLAYLVYAPHYNRSTETKRELFLLSTVHVSFYMSTKCVSYICKHDVHVQMGVPTFMLLINC